MFGDQKEICSFHSQKWIPRYDQCTDRSIRNVALFLFSEDVNKKCISSGVAFDYQSEMQMSKCLFITFKLRGQSNTYFSFEPILAPVCDLVKRLSIFVCPEIFNLFSKIPELSSVILKPWSLSACL